MTKREPEMTREERHARFGDAAKEIVAKAPPFTSAQRDWLAVLLAPVRGEAEDRKRTSTPPSAPSGDIDPA